MFSHLSMRVLAGLGLTGGGVTAVAGFSTEQLTPVLTIAIASLVVLIPLSAKYLELWFEARIAQLSAENAKRHGETIAAVASQVTTQTSNQETTAAMLQTLTNAAANAAAAAQAAAGQAPIPGPSINDIPLPPDTSA